jgi:hypothetical protein
MDSEEFQEELQHAEVLLEEEALRTARPRGPTGVPGQATSSNFMTDEDVFHLRKKHAFLADFSDNFIKNTPIGDLLKIECTAMKMKEMERSKDADDKLAANKAALATTFTLVKEGRDNRWSELHPARFLPGAGCSAVRLWLTARDVLGTSAFLPIGSYDMGAVGLAGYISARGWTELHHISSPKLSIKLFNINSCTSRYVLFKNNLHISFVLQNFYLLNSRFGIVLLY